MSGQAIYKKIVGICEKAGVGPFRFHDLRHTNATIMLEENVPDKYIAERGGWGSEIYKTRYEGTTTSKRQSVNDVINSRFEKKLCNIVIKKRLYITAYRIIIRGSNPPHLHQ